MSGPNTKTIRSLETGLKIVDLIAFQGKPLKFNEIHQLTGITKSNLYKYLNTLTALALLSKDENHGYYSLGSKLIEYGLSAIGNEDIVSKIRPFMEKINDELDETVLFVVFTDKGPMVVNLIKSSRIINIGAEIGTALPIFTASGKIFAAFLSHAKAEKWKKNELEKLEEEYKKIKEDIHEVQINGIAYASEPLAPSVSSISIPIFNFARQLLGAITVVGFFDQEQIHNRNYLRTYLLSQSEEISRHFGYRG